MVAAVGPVSAAHFNPAVTVAFFVLRRIRFVDLFLYWSAQLTGAAVAMLALRIGYAQRLEVVSFGITRLGPDVSVLAGLVVEAVLTFFLMFVITGVVIRKHDLDGLYIRCYGSSRGALRWRADGRVDEPRSQFRPGSGKRCVGKPLDILVRSGCRCRAGRPDSALCVGWFLCRHRGGSGPTCSARVLPKETREKARHSASRLTQSVRVNPVERASRGR